MPRRKQHYQESDWFCIPLERGGYALGLIARMKNSGIFGYFFGARYREIPTLKDAATLAPSEAIARLMFGDFGLLNREWPVLGALPAWDRSKWPMPSFVHKDLISGRLYVRTYDEDTLRFVSERLATSEEAGSLPQDGDFGAGAVISWISDLIQHAEHHVSS